MLHVLVVDDDEILVRTLKRMMRGRFEITAVNTGNAAIEHLVASEHGGPSFDLVLCDARMPDMHGWDVLQAARTCPKSLAFIMMSAMDHQTFGADAYLSKPFALNDFVDVVGQLMSSRPSASSLSEWRGTEAPVPRARSFSAPP